MPQTTEALVSGLLEQSPGVAVGEDHGQLEAAQFLTQNMARFRAQGVTRGQVLFLLEKWWREAGFWFGDVCAVCLAKSVFRC